MKTNIALIGFMGVGKTAIGQALAQMLDRRLVETDALIVEKAGKNIPEIFERHGEIAFREIEIQVIKEVSSAGSQVIACGGGVVLNKINVDRLRQGGVVVLLTASPGVILRRLSTSQTRRPLLEVPDPAKAVQDLLRFRRPFYRMAADITLSTTRLDIKSVVEQIIGRLKTYEGFCLQE